MARTARIVVPGMPHHVTARGNRREPIFFETGDQNVYRRMLARNARDAGVEVWAYCLMPNHVHLVLKPESVEGLAKAIGETHRRYTSFINARAGWTGRLFEDRFASVAMDDRHFLTALAYVSLNPVRAGLVKLAQDWPWSSVRAHLRGEDDELVTNTPLLERGWDFARLLREAETRASRSEAAYEALRAAERTGRPLGTAEFVADLERRLGRPIARRAAGRKPNWRDAPPG